MTYLNRPRCYFCKAIDGSKKKVDGVIVGEHFVMEATPEEVFFKRVPVGCSLCTDCAILTEEEDAARQAGAMDEQFVDRVAAEKQVIAAELKEDLALDAREMAAWSNTFGGW